MIVEQLNRMKAVLQKVTDAVWHYEAKQPSDQYLVWAEKKEAGSLYADDFKLEQVLQGTVDLFTKTENDTLIDTLQDQLEREGISYLLNSVEYDGQTGYIHYEWYWELS